MFQILQEDEHYHDYTRKVHVLVSSVKHVVTMEKRGKTLF